MSWQGAVSKVGTFGLILQRQARMVYQMYKWYIKWYINKK